MATEEITEFTSYEFTQEEMFVAAVFTDEQEKWLQTQLAKYAQMKINLAADDPQFDRPENYVRAHEFHRGLMASMQFIIAMSRELKESQQEFFRDKTRLQELDPQTTASDQGTTQ